MNWVFFWENVYSVFILNDFLKLWNISLSLSYVAYIFLHDFFFARVSKKRSYGAEQEFGEFLIVNPIPNNFDNATQLSHHFWESGE